MFKNIKKSGISLLLIIGLFTTAIDASVPNRPGSYVGVTAIDKTSVRIGFKDNSDDEIGFKVFGEGIDKMIPANDETVKSHIYTNITGLICDKMYNIQVVAYNSEGNSSISDKRYFNIHTTFGLPCDNVPNVPNVPDIPGSYLGVTGINSNSVRVSFLDNSDNELGFRVFGDGIDIIIPENDETVKTYVYSTLTGLQCNKTYQIEALAFNINGTSLKSNSRAFNIHSSFGIECGVNNLPIANAGIDKNVVEGVTVPLNGSGSSDADFDVLTYQWSFISKPQGSVATLNDETEVNPTFDADVNGTYVLQLIVNDGQEDSNADMMNVIVTENNLPPQPPLAIAGENLTVTSNSLILIDGSNSYDPDGTIVSYDWSLYGVSVSDTPSFFFSLPIGTYEITLTVTDDDGLTATDTLTITVENS
jgi:hypothetical protein